MKLVKSMKNACMKSLKHLKQTLNSWQIFCVCTASPYPRATFWYRRDLILEGLQDINSAALRVYLQRQLDNRPNGSRERQFISHILEYLKSCTGGQVETESWVITSYEVDLGHRIGFGGLYVYGDLKSNSYLRKIHPITSGQVYEGIWDKTHVAIKVLNSHSGHAPSSTVCESRKYTIYLSQWHATIF